MSDNTNDGVNDDLSNESGSIDRREGESIADWRVRAMAALFPSAEDEADDDDDDGSTFTATRENEAIVLVEYAGDRSINGKPGAGLVSRNGTRLKPIKSQGITLLRGQKVLPFSDIPSVRSAVSTNTAVTSGSERFMPMTAPITDRSTTQADFVSLLPGAYLIMGPAGSGKSQLAHNVASAAASARHNVTRLSIGEPSAKSIEPSAQVYSMLVHAILTGRLSRPEPTGAGSYTPSVVVVDSLTMLAIYGSATGEGGFSKSVLDYVRMLDTAARISGTIVLAVLNPLKYGRSASNDLTESEVLFASAMSSGAFYLKWGGSGQMAIRPHRTVADFTFEPSASEGYRVDTDTFMSLFQE